METNLDVGDDGVITLALAGEIDVDVAHDLAAAVDKACRSKPRELVIDLAGVTFCDSSGIAQLVRAMDICDCDDASCRITGATPFVGRVFDACGLGEMLEPDGQ